MQSGLCLENIQTPLGLTSELCEDLNGPPGSLGRVARVLWGRKLIVNFTINIQRYWAHFY